MLPDDLIADVKNYLNITWDDKATDQKIIGLMSSGIFYINDKAGRILDYSEDGYGRTLLMEYVRYARDEALDVFESNYRSLLLAMQNNGRVKDYVSKTPQAKP